MLGLESYVDPKLAVTFMEMCALRLEELRIEYDFGGPTAAAEAFETFLVPMFQSGRWRQLKKVKLVGLTAPPVSTPRYRFVIGFLKFARRTRKIGYVPIALRWRASLENDSRVFGISLEFVSASFSQ